MQKAQTMAVKITRRTWPLAIACLAGGFGRIPFSDARGHYLVINDLHARKFKKMAGEAPVLILGNGWMNEQLFHETYKFVGKERKNTLVPVRHRD